MVAPDLEDQPRPIGISEVDGLAVAKVDRRDPAIVDEHSVQAAVVDRLPTALIETQHDVRPRDQLVGNPDVGSKVPADDHVVAGREGAFRPVRANGQCGRRGCVHRDQL